MVKRGIELNTPLLRLALNFVFVRVFFAPFFRLMIRAFFEFYFDHIDKLGAEECRKLVCVTDGFSLFVDLRNEPHSV